MADGEVDVPTASAPEYPLSVDLDGTSLAARENLADILERELLGPKFGPSELLSTSPRQQYLVGHIAPVKLAANGENASFVDEGADGQSLTEVDLDEANRSGLAGVPTPPADENQADERGDDAEDRAPRQGLMIPASMGLRFQVPDDLTSFTVDASWGVYERVETGERTKSDRPIYNYQRNPVKKSTTVDLNSLNAETTTTFPLQDEICLRVDRYDDDQHGRTLIELALCNDRETPTPIPTSMWMFQTHLRVHAEGAEVFLPVRDIVEQTWPEHDDEVRRLNLQYRNRLEFAIGRTCSADWLASPGARRATEVSTTWLPTADTPQTQARAVEGAMLAMGKLTEATPEQLRAGLEPILNGYRDWLAEQQKVAERLPDHLADTCEQVLYEANQVHGRLVKGLEHITGNEEALRCFRFMNRTMRDQRIASQVADRRASDPSLTIEQARQAVAELGDQAASWRTFQLAFILMQLGSLSDPASKNRSADHLASVELLFFPTGGGKTEAYLGLAAYTFAVRRRQGIVESTEGPLDGTAGVAVLMRYTLRLLTSQQFQRATALICAAELARREDETTWGTEPFRIGLWVGTNVSPKRFEEAKKQLQDANEYGRHRLPVLQVQRCPWCGTPITAAQVKTDDGPRRVFVYCGDELAQCPFSKGGGVDEGLPVLTVDEEIYRLAPAFVIATVDKFARLAREGEAASLFGYVHRKCGRHGYAHPDFASCDIKTAHPKTDKLPSATIQPVGRLRPPDLIIQDELHLITGALGTAVGLFEVAIETLCSWETAEGQSVRPLIVASTATVRNAENQVRGLYGRRVQIFPPQVLDVADTFFSKEVPVSSDRPGRRYVGVSAQGVRLSSAEIRVAQVLLSAGQLLLDQAGTAADPYATLVGYFNATRELAGMARYLADDVATRVGNPEKWSGFPRRYGTDFGNLNVAELTSRIASSEIGRTLDRLSLEFDPDLDTTAAFEARRTAINEGKPVKKRGAAPFDVVLATSMLQVGVDVQRLGLMLVVGQPKNTAEYIQASSRVGRDNDRPGLVVALGNWARPRDLAHFEQFRHYHETFYSQVEALSVTPFSATSLERGIDALLVSITRVQQASEEDGLSPEHSAGRIRDRQSDVEQLIGRLRDRIAAAAQDEEVAKRARDLLTNRIDHWTRRARTAVEETKTLVYERTGRGDEYLPLLMSPENAKTAAGSSAEAPFTVANSMREVQPEINVLVSPKQDRLFMRPAEGSPEWTLPPPPEDES